MAELGNEVRSFWNLDAATYDNATGHHPRSTTERAAWSAAMRRLLPAPPARVLDVGAGTGFLSILLARQGYSVSALDLAPLMLERLNEKAAQEGLVIMTIEGDAAAPPHDGFDAVVERHVLWTLPDPAGALDSWHDAAPAGRLVLFESEWGNAVGPTGRAQAMARKVLRQLRHTPPDHHGEYDPNVRAQLPLGGGTTPDQLLSLIEGSSWGAARIERLRDLDWAARRAMPSAIDRIIGVPPRFAVVAG